MPSAAPTLPGLCRPASHINAEHIWLRMGAAGSLVLLPAYDRFRVCSSATHIIAQPCYALAEPIIVRLQPSQLRVH